MIDSNRDIGLAIWALWLLCISTAVTCTFALLTGCGELPNLATPIPTPHPYSGAWDYTTRVGCTGSMEPTITCRDVVYIWEPPRGHVYKVGDIVIYRNRSLNDCLTLLPDQPTIHRIVEDRRIGRDASYITQGDNNPKPDGCGVSRDQIKGLVVYIDKEGSTP